MTLDEKLHQLIGLPKSAKVFSTCISVGSFGFMQGTKVVSSVVEGRITFKVFSTRAINMDRTLSCFCCEGVVALKAEQIASANGYTYTVEGSLLSSKNTAELLQQVAEQLQRYTVKHLGVL